MFGFFKSLISGRTEQPEAVPVNANDNNVGNGWVEVLVERNNEGFENVEMPALMAVSIVEADVNAPNRVDEEASRMQELLKNVKAKTALRKHLEEVMFADPVTGKDVRFSKSSNTHSRSSTASKSVRRVNAQSGTQRAKKTSGKSNDRKVHCAIDFTIPGEV